MLKISLTRIDSIVSDPVLSDNGTELVYAVPRLRVPRYVHVLTRGVHDFAHHPIWELLLQGLHSKQAPGQAKWQ